MSSLWNTWQAKFCALSLWAILWFFTKFLTSLRIWEGYPPYRDAHDNIYAENACSSSERYTGKRKACALTLMLLVCTQPCYVCPTSSRHDFICGSDLVVGALIWQGLPCGFPPSMVMTLLGCWLYWNSDPDDFTSALPSNLNFASK